MRTKTKLRTSLKQWKEKSRVSRCRTRPRRLLLARVYYQMFLQALTRKKSVNGDGRKGRRREGSLWKPSIVRTGENICIRAKAYLVGQSHIHFQTNGSRRPALKIGYLVNLSSLHALVDAAQSLNCNVIAWICGCLVEKGDRFTIQGHVFSFEAQVPNPSHIILAVAVVILEKQGYRCRRVPQRSIQKDLGNIIATRKVNRLCGRKISCCAEVKVVSVSE